MRRFVSTLLMAAVLILPAACDTASPTQVIALDKPAVECFDLSGAKYCKYEPNERGVVRYTRNGQPIMVTSYDITNADTQLPPIWLPIVRGPQFWSTYGYAIEKIAQLGWASLVVVAFYGEELLDALLSAFAEEEESGSIECGTVDMYFTCWA